MQIVMQAGLGRVARGSDSEGREDTSCPGQIGINGNHGMEGTITGSKIRSKIDGRFKFVVVNNFRTIASMACPITGYGGAELHQPCQFGLGFELHSTTTMYLST